MRLAGVVALVQSGTNTQVVAKAAASLPRIGAVDVIADTGAIATLANGFEYVSSGDITSVSPNSGREGTRVTIGGSSLRAGGTSVASVTLRGVSATIVRQSDTEIVVEAGVGPSSQSIGDVVLVSDTGASVTESSGFTYVQPGSIQVVTPSSGQRGTQVSITGNFLCGVGTRITNVTLAGFAATISRDNCNLVQVVVNDLGANVVGNVVLIADTGDRVTSVDGWTQLAGGNITSVRPAAGQSGTLVTIQGDELFAGGTSVISVSFGGIPALIQGSNNRTYIVARVNPGPLTRGQAVGDVVITGDNGNTVRKIGGWTYSVVDSITPSFGQGGTRVTISGVGLLAGGSSVTSVTLVGVAASSIPSASDTSIVVVATVQTNTADNTGLALITLNNGQTVSSLTGLSNDIRKEWTYKVPGAVSSVVPARGQASTLVTITGTQLLGYGNSVASVTLAGVSAVLVDSNTTVVVVRAAASGPTSVGEVVLVADTGAIVRAASAFQYVAAGSVSSVLPNYGQSKTRVTITGTNLLSGDTSLQQVSLAGIAVDSISGANNTDVVVVAGVTSVVRLGSVVLTASNGASVTLADGFEYKTPGDVTSVSPSSGHGGTFVTITGTDLRGWGSSVATVTLNGVVAGIESENDTHVIVRAAASVSAGSGAVVLTSSSGAEVREAGGWTYLAAGDIVTVSPSSGQVGTLVTIQGTNLLGGGSGAVSVTLFGQEVSSIGTNTNTRIVVVAAARSAGTGAVVIRANTGAIVTKTAGWEQLEEGVINTVVPSSGQLGTVVTINGLRLLGGGADLVSVTLSGLAATYTANTATNTRVVAVASSGSAGPAGVVRLVADTGAVVSKNAAFSYVTAGDITLLVPNRGQGGTRVIISGTNLLGGGSNIASVVLAGVAARSIEHGNDTAVVVIAEARSGALVGNVVVTADTGAVTTEINGFEYLAVPTINTVAPGSGQEGTRVTISGTNLLVGGSSVASVTLANEVATSIESQTNTQIVVVAAASAAKTGAVVVRLASGSEAIKSSSWEYLVPGVIDTVTPSSGQRGSRVVIVGERLAGGGVNVTGVQLAGTAVERIVSSNQTHVVVIAALGSSAVTGSVVLTADTGAVVSRAAAWSYLAPGAITQVSPSFGQEGTRVTISGTRLLGDGSSASLVTLAGVSATITDSSQIEVKVTAASSVSARTGDVIVVSNTGIIVTRVGGWEYRDAGVIAALEPTSGVEGTQVLIYGSNLFGHGTSIASLTLAGVPATIRQQTNFFVRAVAGAGSPGAPGSAVLTSVSGAVVSKTNAWQYVARGDITAVAPSRGSPGTVVVITGTSLLSGGGALTQVTLAGVVAEILGANDTHVTVEANSPRGTSEIVGDVILTSDNGAVTTESGAWTYVAASDIHTVVPSSGQFGTLVTITGVSLLAGGSSVSVTLGGVAVQRIDSQSDSQVVVVAAASSALTGDILLRANTGGSVIRKNGWTYVAVPNIVAVNPAVGQVGTRVTVSGTGLLGGGRSIANATLAGQAVAEIVSSNNTVVVLVAATNGSLSSGHVELVADTGAIITRNNAWTYLEESRIGAVAPALGQGGTFVTIEGSNLRGGGGSIVSVTLASVSAVIVSENNTHVRVRANVGAAGAGHVVLVSNTGARTTRENGWTYTAPGVISSVSPSSGQLNTLVTITGVALLGGGSSVSAASLKGIAVVEVVSAGAGSVVVRTAGGSAGVGSVQLESNTGALVVGTNLWTQLADGAIATVSPANGLVGTRVTITGTSLLGGGASLASVELSGVPAAVESATSTRVVVVAGTGSAGAAGEVKLTADTGATVTKAAAFAYLAAGVVNTLTPNSGQIGTRVTISGSGLLGGGASVVNVTLDGVAVSSVESSSSASVVVIAARSSASATAGDVVLVANTGAVVTGSSKWTYATEGSISTVVPNVGRVGTLVTVSGSSLRGSGASVASVVLGGVTARQIVSQTDTEVQFVPADRAAGLVDVVLVADTGATVTKTDGFTYTAGSSIALVEPARGQLGTRVTITGTGFFAGGSQVAQVSLNGIPVQSIVTSADDSVVVRAAASNVLGLGDVVVVSDTGAEVRRLNGWTYETASNIDSVTPGSGQLGTVVTIVGTQLFGRNPLPGSVITSVLLAGEAPTIVSANQTHVIVTATNVTARTGSVLLEASSGAQAVKLSSWEYLPIGVISSVFPSQGQLGTRVTIDGSGMRGGGSSVASVTLAGVAAVITGQNDTRIVVTAAASSARSGHVVVTANTGAVVSLENSWTYNVASAISTVTPSVGQVDTIVTIAGTSLLGSGNSIQIVRLAGVVALVQSGTNTRVVAKAAASLPRIGAVDVIADTGAIATLANGFEYVSSGDITSVSPNSGREGTRVTIGGSSLRAGGTSVASVTLRGVSATIVRQSDTEVVVEAGVGPSSQSIGDVVLVSDTGASVTESSGFTYVQPGSIQVVTPSSGQRGTQVSITGNFLCGVGTRITNVTLAGFAATISRDNCNLVQVVVNDLGANVVGNVVLIADTGDRVTSVDGWTQLAGGNITSVRPAAGQSGTLVTIQGDELFAGGTSVISVSFGGIPALIQGSNNRTYIVARVNPGPLTRGQAVGDVVITGDNGNTVRKIGGWTYSVVDSITPSFGQGGTRVTISGVGLLAGGSSVTSVTLVGVAASSIPSASDTSIVVVATVQTNTADNTGLALITLNNGQTVSSLTGLSNDIRKEWTYKVPGAVSSVVPARGQASTLVTITGTQLLGYGNSVASVTLAGVSAALVDSNTTVVVVRAAASGPTSVGEVVLVSDTGAIVRAASAFQYVAAGSVSSVSPNYGQSKTRVTITGTNLLSGDTSLQQVSLAGIAVDSISGANNTDVVVVAGVTSVVRLGSVVLTASNGASVTLADGFEYKTPGDVTSVSPSSGHGGTFVTITGTDLRGWGSSVATVTLNGVLAGIESENDTHVIVRAAASVSAGSGAVVLTSSSGAEVREAGGWTYLAAGDIVTVSPSSGQVGTLVTIQGTNLLGGGSSAVSVTLFGQEVSSIGTNTNTRIVVVAAARSAGTGAVVIRANTGAIVTKTAGWEQLEEGVINTVVPSSGQLGTVVTINGLRLLGGGADLVSVTLSGLAATYTANTATNTRVVAVASSGSAGPAGVVRLVADTGAVVSKNAAFSYVTAGDITLLVPNRGQGGTRVFISGTNLLGGGSNIASVVLAGVAARSIEHGNDTAVVVIAEARSGALVGNVVVTADTGAVTTEINGFEYLAVPTINTVAPGSGQEGTRVTISGTNLLVGGSSVASVTLANEVATSIESQTNTQIVVVAAASAAKTGDVVVRLASGSEAIKSSSWEYLVPGVIDTVTPSSGQRGSRVVIVGERLAGGGVNVTGVQLAGTAVERIVSSNQTHVVVIAALGSSAVTGSVVLTADTGAVVSRAAAWSYLAPGAITQVLPSFGQEGTRVTISGTRLLGDGSSASLVTLAGVSATITDSSQIEVKVTAASSVSARTGDVIVVSNTGIIVTRVGGWEYRDAGVIAALEPTSGVEGTQVLIYGSNLFGHGTSIVSLTLAGVPATIRQQTNFFVRAVAGAGSPGAPGSAVLTSVSGAVVSKTNAWQYVARGDITAVAPSRGSPGTVVVITGTSLLSGGGALTQVTLAGVVAEILGANDTHVTVEANSPRGTSEIVGDVILTSDNGAVTTESGAWTYVAASDIHTVVPSSGQFGTLVTITGVSLLAGGSSVSVTLGGVAVQRIDSQSDSQVVVVAAASSALTGDILLRANTGGSVIRKNGWTYVAVPNIVAVNPAVGQVGTRVTVSGTGLLGGGRSIANATLAGQAVAEIVSSNNTVVVLVAATNGSLSSGHVELVADTGAIITRNNAWTYLEESRISAVAPALGQGGTFVTIEGSNLRGGGGSIVSVTLASVSAVIVSENNTHVRVRANVGAAGAGHVVLVSNTGARTTRENGWTYTAPGVVSSVSPSSGQLNTLVTITGVALLGGGSSVSAASLKGIAVVEVVSASAGSVVVKAAGGSAGVGSVQLESNTGALVVGTNLWTQLADGAIATVSPANGLVGTRVTITGTSLLGGGASLASVELSGVPAAVESAISTRVVVVAGTGSAGAAGEVKLTADTGATVTKTAAFAYLAAGVVNTLTPNSGQIGTRVTISGSGLLGGGASVVNVTLDGVAVSSVETSSGASVVVIAARSSASATAGDVILVANTGAVVTGSSKWTYATEGSISTVVPNVGRVGTLVTVSGSSLRGSGASVASVVLGGVTARQIVSQTDTEVQFVPADRAAGLVDFVLVADTGATVTKTDGFTYTAGSSIALVEPARGQLGTRVTITGTGFFAGGSQVTQVSLNGIPVQSIVTSADDSVVVRAAASNVLGLGDVVVVSDTGAEVRRLNGWTYETASNIDSVTPGSGQLGTVVTIVGTQLLGRNPLPGSVITSVLLAGVAPTIVSANQTHVIVTATNVTARTGSVLLEASSGAQAVKLSSWEYLPIGVINSVFPSQGQLGTRVTIDGSGMRGGGSSMASVTLAGVAAAITGQNDTRIVVTAASSSARSGHVVVTANTGAVVSLENSWTYNVASAISTVTPSVGQVDTIVTIAGTSLLGSGSSIQIVRLAGVVALVQSGTNTQVVAKAAASLPRIGAVDVIADTGAIATLANGFEYVSSGDITSVSPNSGREGTRVTIGGSSLRAGGTSVASVTLRGVSATIVRQSDTEIVVEAGVGPSSQSIGDVVLVSDTGASVTESSGFTYVQPGSIQVVTPSSGQRGTQVSITGNFLCGVGTRITNVTLAGFAATISRDNCNLVQVVVNDLGANVVGNVVLIADTGDRVTSVDGWTQLAGGNITSVRPAAGQSGTLVTIQGDELFAGGTSVISVSFVAFLR